MGRKMRRFRFSKEEGNFLKRKIEKQLIGTILDNLYASSL